MSEGLEERREAELEFVSCAYSSDEAFHEISDEDKLPIVYRRLFLSSTNEDDSVSIKLMMKMPALYPESESLVISGCVEHAAKDPLVTKRAYTALPKLVGACQSQAQASVGEEAVFLVLSAADEWIQEEWPNFQPDLSSQQQEAKPKPKSATSSSSILGRRLIYSHHIISKVKRGNIHNLASHYKLTGYMKVGWPGLMVIEGAEEDCLHFYDEIRPWSWRFLVVRGEQQEKVADIESSRKFSQFLEVEDMSTVAQHCRQVGLEPLFKTSMKVYDNSGETDAYPKDDGGMYGTLVLVDHMNDGKGYRKWLRKTAKELGIFLLIRQCYPKHDFSKRPLIIVAVVGDVECVQQFMKRWRTSRVDVDSRGKPCLERMMSVLVEGDLAETKGLLSMDWDSAQADGNVNTSVEQLGQLLLDIGGTKWSDAIRTTK